MKIIICIIFLSITTFLFRLDIQNKDKPLKGEWNFNIKQDWVVSEAGKNIIARIKDIKVDKNGNVLVWDSKQLKIFVYDSKGKFLYDFARKGEGPGEIMDIYASSIFIRDNNIIIHEMNSGRVNLYSLKGKYLTTKKISKRKYGYNVKTYIDKNNFIFMTTSENDNDKAILGIYKLKDNSIDKIILSKKDDVLEIKEKSLTIRNETLFPNTIFGYNKGKIYYGRNDEYRINIYDIKTKKKSSFSISGRKRKTVNKEFKENFFKSFKMFLEPKYINIAIKKCPSLATYFDKIAFDNAGNIYVFIPVLNNENRIEMDIFSPNGNYIYHALIDIPGKYEEIRNFVLCENGFYISAQDKDGEIKLLKFKANPPNIKHQINKKI